MEDESVKENIFLVMLKGLGISMIITLLAIFILSLILSFSSVSENVIIPSVIFFSSFSILIGSFLVAKKIDNRGIVYGSLLGLIYMIILYLVSSILNSDFALNFNSIIMIAMGIVGGAVGGIIGINLK